jgi:hypothetical protein
MPRRILTERAGEKRRVCSGKPENCGGKSWNKRIKSVGVRLGKADDAERDH